MGQAKGCLWYQKGKLRDLGNPGTFEPAAIPDPVWEGQDIDFGMQDTYFSELGPYQTGQPRGKFHIPDGAIPHGPMGYIVAIADGWAEV